MKQKLNLNTFSIKSFVTSLGKMELKTINGGAIAICNKLSTCPATCEEKYIAVDTGNTCMSDAGGNCKDADKRKAC